MAAPKAQGAATLNAVEVRLSGGMLALVRFLMTLQNKRMPVAGFTVGREDGPGEALRVTILLDCPPDSAHRYATLLSALEDVEEIEEDGETMEVALLKVVGGGALREVPAGIGLHEEGGTVVASGPAGKLEAWLASMGNDVEDAVRLGPVARPGTGGV